MSGGISRIINGFKNNGEGDSWNFTKAGFKVISPEYGEDIYNMTQIAIGLLSIGSGLKSLTKVLSTKGFLAGSMRLAQGESYWVNIVFQNGSIMKQYVLDSGLIAKTVSLDYLKMLTTLTSVGIDFHNTDATVDSYFYEDIDQEIIDKQLKDQLMME